jgi:hypothetical protein
LALTFLAPSASLKSEFRDGYSRGKPGASVGQSGWKYEEWKDPVNRDCGPGHHASPGQHCFVEEHYSGWKSFAHTYGERLLHYAHYVEHNA